MWFRMPAAHWSHQNVLKHIKAVQELLEGIFDSDLDSDECANTENFADIKDDSSDAF
jgi:hypothetical protein